MAMIGLMLPWMMLIVGQAYGLVSIQYLDMVALRCLDKVLNKQQMQESKLGSYATAAAEEMLQTLEFLNQEYNYQVAVVVGGLKSEGYCNSQRNHTGQRAPTNDLLLVKSYPMGEFSAFAFIYAAEKR